MDLLGASHWLAQDSAGEVVDPDTAAAVGDAVVGATVVGSIFCPTKILFRKNCQLYLQSARAIFEMPVLSFFTV